MSARSPLFSRWALALLLSAGLASLSAAVGLALWSDPRDQVRSHQADTFSRSALGHKALVGLMRERGWPILISRYDSAARAAQAGLTLSAEPHVSRANAQAAAKLTALLDAAPASLVVLPKRIGAALHAEEGFIDEVLEVALDDTQATLEAAGGAGLVVRRHDLPSERASWRCTGYVQAPCKPVLYDMQLLAPDPRLTPLVAADEGILVAELTGAGGAGRRFIIADPDLIANHGLHRGQNAALVAALLGAMRHGQGVVLIDEVLHGYEQRPSLIRELGRFPLVLVSAQALLLALLVLWAGVRRFGPPRPDEAPTVADKTAAIAHTAALVHVGRHTAYMTQRYVAVTIEQVAARLGAPAGLDASSRVAWLDELARARGVRGELGALLARVEALRLARRARAAEWADVARKIWSWRRAMLDEQVV
jgi:hypothetical protein